MRKWVQITLLVGIGVLVVLIVVGDWAVQDADRYLPRWIADIQEKTGRQIEIRHAAVTLFPLTVRLEGVGVRNPKPFPPGYFLQAPAVKAAVEVAPLVRGKIVIESLVLEQPVIDFISNPDGLWNFQNATVSPQQKMRFTLGSIARLKIDKGKLLGSVLLGPSGKPGPVVLEIDNFSASVRQIDFDAFQNVPGTQVAGHLDADTARFGDIHVTNLHSGMWVAPEQLTLKNFQVKTYRGRASGNFTMNLAGKNPSFHADLNVSGIGVPYLLGEFEPGPAKMTGMMTATLTVNGEIEHTATPLAGIAGAGTFVVQDGELPSMDSNPSMVEMKRFREASAAAKPASAFSQFGGDVELKHQRIDNRKVAVDFYGVDLEGGGSLDEASGGLNYRGAATIMKKQGFFMTTFARMFKGAKEKQGKLTFPIRVAGTLSDPQFSVVK